MVNWHTEDPREGVSLVERACSRIISKKKVNEGIV